MSGDYIVKSESKTVKTGSKTYNKIEDFEVTKTFSDFESLNEALESIEKSGLSKFPSKKEFGKPEKLERWLKSIIKKYYDLVDRYPNLRNLDPELPKLELEDSAEKVGEDQSFILNDIKTLRNFFYGTD